MNAATRTRQPVGPCDRRILRIASTLESMAFTAGDGFKVTTSKSDAGLRDVTFPPHLLPVIENDLDRFVPPGRDSRLFPSVGDPARHPGD